MGTVVRGLWGNAVPTQVVASDNDHPLVAGVLLRVTPEIDERLERCAGELLWLSTRLRSESASDPDHR